MTQASFPCAFAALRVQVNALSAHDPVTVRAGHADLGAGLWLSCDPEGRTEMTCRPEEEGFRLTVTEGDSGVWACLGLRLPRDILERGRYLALVIEAESEGPAIFSPCLRYLLLQTKAHDVGPPKPMVLSATRQTHLCHFPIDEGLLSDSSGCELNLFFETDQADMRFIRLVPLLVY